MEYTDDISLQRTQRKTFSKIGLACFAILAIATALQLGANLLISRFAPQWTDQPWYFWTLAFLPLYAIGVPIGFALFHRAPEYKIATRKLRFRDLLIFLVMCFPVMYIGNLVGTFLSTLLHAVIGTENYNPLDSLFLNANIWLNLVFMVILAPVIEEFIFRKLIIDRLRPFGEAVCVLTSALLFGLFHGNFNQFFYAFGLGAIFAFLYVKTGRLRYTIILHMAINLLGGIVAPLLLKDIDLNALTQMNKTDPQAMMRMIMEQLPQVMVFGLYSMLYLSLVIGGVVLLITRRRAFYFEKGTLPLQKGSGFKLMFLNAGMILFVIGTLAMFALSLL